MVTIAYQKLHLQNGGSFSSRRIEY